MAAYLSSVAYAYTLMMPGNAIVYYNPQQFGTIRSFPKQGRGDALGGLYGNAITTLVDLRNRYGRGNYLPRLTEKESFAFEREKSALVLLSNRVDSGYDDRTISTGFQQGQYLIELTGNAHNSLADPGQCDSTGDSGRRQWLSRRAIPAQRQLNGHIHRQRISGLRLGDAERDAFDDERRADAGRRHGQHRRHDRGSDRICQCDDARCPTSRSSRPTRSTSRCEPARCICWTIPNYRDADADGDNALLRIDGGLDLNGTGTVDYRVARHDELRL